MLRGGITIVPGIKIDLCAFKLASGLNPATLRAYEGNNLGVMRQVRRSTVAAMATPKNVTLERFGQMGQDGPKPFHLYSMRQAMEEGFIFDVLRNYQNYSSYAKLEKAMVVKASREHAKYMEDNGYTDVRALVAFSGEITIDGQPYTEIGMNGFGET